MNFFSAAAAAAAANQQQQQQQQGNAFFVNFIPVNINFYFGAPFGQDFSAFMNEAFDPQQGARGPPPASKKAVDSLPVVPIKEAGHCCAVCQDEFSIGENVTMMPCKHPFHRDCVLPWLKDHNTCPICRYQLMTDDEQYNERVREHNQSYNVTEEQSLVENQPAPVAHAHIDMKGCDCAFQALNGQECALLEDHSISTLSCNHQVHTECLVSHQRIINNSDNEIVRCPVCRSESTIVARIAAGSDNDEEQDNIVDVSKLDLINCDCAVGAIRQSPCVLLEDNTTRRLECKHSFHNECLSAFQRISNHRVPNSVRCPVCNHTEFDHPHDEDSMDKSE